MDIQHIVEKESEMSGSVSLMYQIVKIVRTRIATTLGLHSLQHGIKVFEFLSNANDACNKQKVKFHSPNLSPMRLVHADYTCNTRIELDRYTTNSLELFEETLL
ncbi:hypothetical protein LOAG_00941 [Loa loa]|uniref:Uncharacterized protein n=1 Tax=Loa loa TaxID=7209 RepID=A0A1S0UA59_LOALO|nr:hypothetical protein LOAG_00941 [Loa loa]EFO27543.1 hypothetical protein LOAG_00941 [Loa loa]